MGVKLHPSTYVLGGLLNDVDVELKEIRWSTFDFQGTVDRPVLAARCVFTVIDGDGEEHEQFLSAGSLDRFIPNDEDGGKSLVKVGTANNLIKGTNWDLFVSSIIDKGGDLGPLDEDISVLDGAKFHVVRIPAPKRSGSVQRKSDREPEILVVEKVISLPWDKKGAAKKAQSQSSQPKAADKAKSGGKVELTDEETMSLINATGSVLASGPVSLSSLKMSVFRELAKDKSVSVARRSVLSSLVTAEWLAENGFAVDGETASMPDAALAG